MWRNSLAAALIAVAIGPAGAQEPVAAPATAVCSDEVALIRVAPERALSFSIKVADTPESRAQGLMFRQDLPAGQGMLFIYPGPQPVSFWMRNTLIPLDMVFIDARGVIRHIHANARPLDETPIPGAAVGDPDPDRLMVLEIAGGEAARLGLQPGMVLAHPGLDPTRAAWPCG